MTDDDLDLQELEELYSRIVERNDYYEWLGLEPVEVDRGRVVGRVPFDERLTTPRSISVNSLHGGVLATLIDLSAIAAILTRSGWRTTVVTTDMNISFGDVATESALAEAEVTEYSDTTATASVVVHTESGERDSEPLATGEVTTELSR